MTNKQRKAIYRLDKDKDCPLACGDITVVNIADIDTALLLIKEQQEEIVNLKNKNVLIKRYFKKCDLIKQLKKQIDLMAKYWNTGLAICDNCDKIVEKYEKNNCKDCIKQYFADLVEKEN